MHDYIFKRLAYQTPSVCVQKNFMIWRIESFSHLHHLNHEVQIAQINLGTLMPCHSVGVHDLYLGHYTLTPKIIQIIIRRMVPGVEKPIEVQA